MSQTNPLETCPTCGGTNNYISTSSVSARGHHGPNLLPGLGGFWAGPRMRIVVCGHCGLTRFFATRDELSKLPNSPAWTRVGPATT